MLFRTVSHDSFFRFDHQSCILSSIPGQLDLRESTLVDERPEFKELQMISYLHRGTMRRHRFAGLVLAAIVISCLPAPTIQGGHFSDIASNVAMVTQTVKGKAYWPHWRGPTVQGLVQDKGYPERWSETENVSWKVAVPGRGHSSPIIWADRIFLTTANPEGSRRSLLSFRRSDGKLLWSTAVPESAAERLYQKNSYASSSPTTDGELIYAYFGN